MDVMKTKRAHLRRLKELATNFDEEERQVVLSCISESEIRAYLECGPSEHIKNMLQ